MNKPTKAQVRALRILERHWEQRGAQPDLRKVADAYGASYVSLRQQLGALADKGYLEIESQGKGKTPIIRLLKERGVPVLGEVTAGELSFKEQVTEHYLKIPLKAGRFALRVRGDSMSDYINDGDVIVLERGRPYYSGQICAVRLGDETTLKYVDTYHDGSAVLRPHNLAYAPVDVASVAELDIAGVHVGHVSGPIVGELLEAA